MAKAAKTVKKAKKAPAAKAVKKAPAAKAAKKVKGLAELKRSSVPMNFVKKNNGSWDHAAWLAFLDDLKAKGYEIEDTDQVGLLLEDKKEQYLAK